jgi:hypothetical protein
LIRLRMKITRRKISSTPPPIAIMMGVIRGSLSP